MEPELGLEPALGLECRPVVWLGLESESESGLGFEVGFVLVLMLEFETEGSVWGLVAEPKLAPALELKLGPVPTPDVGMPLLGLVPEPGKDPGAEPPAFDVEVPEGPPPGDPPLGGPLSLASRISELIKKDYHDFRVRTYQQA